nr:MAG TPA: hypothetical protein [Caudoviricetes sp.]
MYTVASYPSFIPPVYYVLYMMYYISSTIYDWLYMMYYTYISLNP